MISACETGRVSGGSKSVCAAVSVCPPTEPLDACYGSSKNAASPPRRLPRSDNSRQRATGCCGRIESLSARHEVERGRLAPLRRPLAFAVACLETGGILVQQGLIRDASSLDGRPSVRRCHWFRSDWNGSRTDRVSGFESSKRVQTEEPNRSLILSTNR